VVADVALGEVPGCEPDVEPRIGANHLGVNRVDLVELAVRRRQQRVKQPQTEVLFVIEMNLRHGTPLSFNPAGRRRIAVRTSRESSFATGATFEGQSSR